MKLSILSFGLAALASAAAAQPAAQPPLVVQMPELRGAGMLKVMSTDYAAGAAIPLRNSGYGDSLSPQVSWTRGPSGTKSYAILMEDSDANHNGVPITHWLAYNLPASVTAVPGGLPPKGTAAEPAGMLEGANIRGAPGYTGPHPPANAPHHYHLQVLALDTVLSLPAGADRPTFVAAAKGHVLASGEMVGVYTGPAAP